MYIFIRTVSLLLDGLNYLSLDISLYSAIGYWCNGKSSSPFAIIRLGHKETQTYSEDKNRNKKTYKMMKITGYAAHSTSIILNYSSKICN